MNFNVVKALPQCTALNLLHKNTDWPFANASIRQLFILNHHVDLVCDKFTRMAFKRKEAQLSAAWYLITANNRKRQLPFHWSVFGALFRSPVFFFFPSLSLSCLTSSYNSECSILCWGVFSNTGLTQQSSFAVIRHCFPNFVSENEAALGHGIWLCASKRAKPFGVKQDRDNKRGGDTMWEGSGSACLSARLLFVFLSDKSI